MRRARNRLGKKYTVGGSSTDIEVDEIATLKGAGEEHHCIVSIPTENAVALASENKIRVFSLDKIESEATVVFVEHTRTVKDVVNVSGDVLVSADDDGELISWHSATGNVIDKLKLGDSLWSVAKVDDTRIAIGSQGGELIVVAHNHGTELSEIHRIDNAHSKVIISIAVNDKKLVTGSWDESAAVWDTSNYQRLATFKFDFFVYSVAICAEYIAVVYSSNNIDIYENGPDFKLHSILTNNENWITTVTFIDSDTLMIGASESISFISVSRRHYISRVCKLDNETLYSVRAQVVRDGRIAVTGYTRADIISAPPQVEQQLIQYASQQYSSLSALVEPTLPPLQSAWNAVNDGTLDIVDACELITEEICLVSIDEWTFGHLLLMRGVRDGVIPNSFDYKDVPRYWLRKLYIVCASLVMGEKDIDFVIRFLKQAVAAGVIGDFAIDDFIHRVRTCKDFAVGERKLVNAIWLLFMRQAELDERLQRVIRYQEIQKLTSLFTAILGCVPLAGGIVARVIGGGASILNGFEVHGLVESLLGIGKDVSAFGTEPLVDRFLVDRFLLGSAELLSEEKWEKLPVEKKKGVADAAESLGLSIPELREKLSMACKEPSPQITEVTVVETVKDHNGATEKPNVVTASPLEGAITGSEELVERVTVVDTIDEHDIATEKPDVVMGLGQAGPNAAAVSSVITPSPSEGATTSVDHARATLQAELSEWKERGLDKQIIERLDTEQVAACVAAYLVNYNEKRMEQFEEFKTTLMNAFHDGLIEGRSFASATTDEREVAAAVALDAISEMCDKKLVRMAKVVFERFMRELHRESSC